MSRTRRIAPIQGVGGTGILLNAEGPTREQAAQTVDTEQPVSKLNYLYGKDKELNDLDRSISKLTSQAGGLVQSSREDPCSRQHIIYPKYTYGNTLSFYDKKKKKELREEHVMYSLVREKMTTKLDKKLKTTEHGEQNISKKNKQFFKDLETLSRKMSTKPDSTDKERGFGKDTEPLLVVVRGVKTKDDDAESIRKNYINGTYFYCHQRGKIEQNEEIRHQITNELIKYYINNVHDPHIRFTMDDRYGPEGEYLDCLARFDTKRDEKTIREIMKDEIILTLCNMERIESDIDDEENEFLDGIENFIFELFDEVRKFFKEKKYLEIARQTKKFKSKNRNSGIPYIMQRGYDKAFGLKSRRGGDDSENEITFYDDLEFLKPSVKAVHRKLKKVMKITKEKSLNEYEHRIDIENLLKEEKINFLAPVIFANQKRLYNPKSDNEFIVVKAIKEKLADIIINKFLEHFYIPYRKRIQELKMIRSLFFEKKFDGYYLRSGEFDSQQNPKYTAAYSTTIVVDEVEEEGEESEGELSKTENFKKIFKGDNKYIDPSDIMIGDINLLLGDFNFIRNDQESLDVYKKATGYLLPPTTRTKKMRDDLSFPNPFKDFSTEKKRENERNKMERMILRVFLDNVIKNYKAESDRFHNYTEKRKEDIKHAVLWHDRKKAIKTDKQLKDGDSSKNIKPLVGEDLKKAKAKNRYKKLQYNFWNPHRNEKIPKLMNMLAEFSIKHGAAVFFLMVKNDPEDLENPDDYRSKVKPIFRGEDDHTIHFETEMKRKMLVFSSEKDPSEILFNYCLYAFHRGKKPFFIGENGVMKKYYDTALDTNLDEIGMDDLRNVKDRRYFKNLTYVEDIDEYYRIMKDKY